MKLYRFALALVLFAALLWTTQGAVPEPGSVIGSAYYSGKKVTIDDCPIPAYEIGGKVFVIAEELTQYGFAVEWRPEEDRLIVLTERTAVPYYYSAYGRYSEITEQIRTSPDGGKAADVLSTRITTWIGEQQVTGYNLGGRTCIPVNELIRTDTARDLSNQPDTIHLTTFDFVPEDRDWQFSHKTPGYGTDAPTEGDYAVWEFEKKPRESMN